MISTGTPRIDKFLDVYNRLSVANLPLLQQIYHPDVVFIDPVQQVNGLSDLTGYFEHTYARIAHCTFAGQERMEQQQQGFLSWQMQFSHPAINNSNLVTVAGCSLLHWQDDLVIYHRDYYDLHQMVFQHIPVLGWITNKVRQKMSSTAR